jgi:hypothetical protein
MAESDGKKNLPVSVEGAGDLAKLTTGIFTAVVGMWFPVAALGAPVVSYFIDRVARRSERILIDELRSDNIDKLLEEQLMQYIPMAYKFFEAAKEGEYEHNLKVLAAYIANELKEDVPDAPNFPRMARRLEGLTKTELKAIALINSYLTTIAQSSDNSSKIDNRPFVSAGRLAQDQSNTDHLTALVTCSP